jgi:hypothetical protein
MDDVMKKTKSCELQYEVSQETLARFQLGLAQSQDKTKNLYVVRYVSEQPNIDDKKLIEKTKKFMLDVLSNPKAIVRSEEVEQITTDSSLDSTLKVHEQVYEIEG